MSRQLNRGYYVHEFAWECYRCCCPACTKRLCPYRQGLSLYQYRCALCARGDFKPPAPCYDCDFFESRYNRPQHFKIMAWRRRPGKLEKKIDAIMKALGVDGGEEK